MQNTYFSGLARKKHFFKRSVLKYVSIKKMLLTPPDQKRRVCINAPDGLTRNCRQGISNGSRPKGCGGSGKKEVVQKEVMKRYEEGRQTGHGRQWISKGMQGGQTTRKHGRPGQAMLGQVRPRERLRGVGGLEEAKAWQGKRSKTQSPLR